MTEHLFRPAGRVRRRGVRRSAMDDQRSLAVVTSRTHEALARVPAANRRVYEHALEREVAAITERGDSRYLLAAVTTAAFARQHGLPVGYIAGKHAASCAVFLLGLSSIDPVASGIVDEAPVGGRAVPLTLDVGISTEHFRPEHRADVELWSTPLVSVVHEAARATGIPANPGDERAALELLARTVPAPDLACTITPALSPVWPPRNRLDVALALHLTERMEQPAPVDDPRVDLIADILEPTAGRLVWTSQVIEVTRRLTGMSLERADMLRRDLGKRLRVDAWREEFLSKASPSTRDAADRTFELLAGARCIGSRAGWLVYANLLLHWALICARSPAAVRRAERSVRARRFGS